MNFAAAGGTQGGEMFGNMTLKLSYLVPVNGLKQPNTPILTLKVIYLLESPKFCQHFMKKSGEKMLKWKNGEFFYFMI